MKQGSSWRPRAARPESGQTLVLFAIALVALLAGVGLVVDGGNAVAQQRRAQNAMDSVSEAGAVELSKDLAAQALNQTPLPITDLNVSIAVRNAASFNGMRPQDMDAYYTTITGRCILSGGGTAAPPCDQAAGAVAVGNGAIPTVSYDAANGGQQCPVPTGSDPKSVPALACGVAASGSLSFATYFAGVVGINQLGASARATAVAGAVTTFCAGNVPCNLLPLTIPATVTSCDGQNKYSYPGSGPYTVVDSPTAANEEIVPICGTGDGSVGWLAFQPEDSSCGGGKSDLECDITTPDNPPLTLPAWINTETGNTNSLPIDTAVNTYDGQVVYLPLFTCLADQQYTGGQQIPTSLACPASGYKLHKGSNLYYRIEYAAPFLLDHAYINGNPKISGAYACDGGNPPGNPGSPPSGGNGATGCLKGWFVPTLLGPGSTVGLGGGLPTTAFGVQLIR